MWLFGRRYPRFTLQSFTKVFRWNRFVQICNEISKDLSIFWGHGNADPQVNHDAWKGLAEKLAEEIKIPFTYHDDDGKRLEAEKLRKSGTNALLFHTYNDLGHWFSSEEIEDLITWISVVLQRSE